MAPVLEPACLSEGLHNLDYLIAHTDPVLCRAAQQQSSVARLRFVGTQQCDCRFDEAATLRCELARKNMYIKDEQSVKRSRYGAEQAYPSYATSTPPAQQPAYYQPAPVAAPVPAGPRAYTSISNTKDNPPCNTLFIGNLGDTVTETELRSIFASQPGFCQLKLNRGAKSVTCFVEFVDVPTAMAVHASQQVEASPPSLAFLTIQTAKGAAIGSCSFYSCRCTTELRQ